MKKSKLYTWLPLMLSLAVVTGIFISFNLQNKKSGQSFFGFEKSSTKQEVLELIKNRYVDDVDLEKISDSSIQSILSKLDPHSVLIPAEELEDINNDIEGSFYGIGIEFDVIDDTLHVISVIKDGPAFKIGLQIGDKIIAAAGKSIAGKKMPSDSMRNILRGNRGTKMNLVVRRNSNTLSMLVERGVIPVNSIVASYMINPEIGYIKIEKFSTQTHREFMFALEDLKKQGMKKLVLDLRENGGGVLDEAVEIADEFLDGDKLITYTEGRHMPKKEYRCKRIGQFEKGELVVLSNDGSASASEVLMGALQDWDRALIIGRRSFGKGLVQEQYDLSDKSAVRLTVARYFSPSGRCIQRDYSKGEKAYYEEIHERLNGKHQEQQIDSSKFFTTSSGKKVYGGGGITPDINIYEDSILYNENSKAGMILNSGRIRRFAYDYFIRNISLKSTYNNLDEYIARFEINDEIWQNFAKSASEDSLDFAALNNTEIGFIKNNIKAHIARIIWNNSAYFKSFNYLDEACKMAIEKLK